MTNFSTTLTRIAALTGFASAAFSFFHAVRAFGVEPPRVVIALGVVIGLLKLASSVRLWPAVDPPRYRQFLWVFAVLGAWDVSNYVSAPFWYYLLSPAAFALALIAMWSYSRR